MIDVLCTMCIRGCRVGKYSIDVKDFPSVGSEIDEPERELFS